MADWYVSVVLDVAATDNQAEVLTQRVGSTLVDHDRGRTEVRTYVTAGSARQAMSEGLERVNVGAALAGLEADVSQVAAMTERDRIEALTSRDIPKVVGVAEIQQILDVNTRQQVGQLAEREDFPEPIETLSAGRIWLRSDIEDFGRRWQRKSRRLTGS